MKTTSRLALIGAAAILAMTASAKADNVAAVDIDNDPAGTSFFTSFNATSPLPPVIVTLQNIFGVNTGTSETGDASVAAEETVADNSSLDEVLNQIYARTTANGVASSIGFGEADLDGAMILAGQSILPGTTSLSADSLGNVVLMQLEGTGTGIAGDVDLNLIEARTAFNAAFSTIETEVPTDLDDIGGGTYLSEQTLGGPDTAIYFPTTVDQTANFNVASVQVLAGVANANDPDPTSLNQDSIIAMAWYLTPGSPDPVASGNFSVDANHVNAATFGNLADNSIYLLLANGGASTFGGTAFVSATQSAQDTSGGVDAPAVSAATIDASIGVIFAAEATNPPDGIFLAFGPPDLLSAEGLDASVDGNAITSSAVINQSRNDLGIDSEIDLAGDDVGVGSTLQITRSAASLGAAVASDFAVVNNQTASGPTGDSPQQATALTLNALTGLAVEDVNANSVLSVSGNTMSANAGGNLNTNLIRNHGVVPATNPEADPLDLGEASSPVVGSFANVNRQLAVEESIDARLETSTILVSIGSLDDGQDSFGGLSGNSTLAVDGNRFGANGTANGSVAVVDLIGSSITSAPGGLPAADIDSIANQDFIANDVVHQDVTSGVNVGNLQFLDLPGDDSFTVPRAQVVGSGINVFVNYDQGNVNADDEDTEIADATISVDGNSAIAAIALNAFSGTVDLAAATSVLAGVGMGSLQYTSAEQVADSSLNFHAPIAVIRDFNVSVDLGVTGAASNILATADGNEFLALATGNESSLSAEATAGTTIIAEVAAGPNAIVSGGDAIAPDEARSVDIGASAGYLAVSNQTLRVAANRSEVISVDLDLLLAGPGNDEPVVLSDTVLSLSANTLLSHAVGNRATNSIGLAAGTTIEAVTAQDAGGALAGIVSSQSAVTEDRGQSGVFSLLAGAQIHAAVLLDGEVGSIDNLALAVNGNVLEGRSASNSVTNAISVSALNLEAADTDGVLLTADNSGIDLTLTAADAALYIVNRQRNEGADPDYLRGPRVSSVVSDNILAASVNGGIEGVSDSVLALSANEMQANSFGNSAFNSIAINPVAEGDDLGDLPDNVVADAAAGIINRQGNSGNVSSGNIGNQIEAELLGEDGAVMTNVTFKVDGNAIGSSATGNGATNVIVGLATVALNGTNTAGLDTVEISDAPVSATAIAAIDTDTASFDSNATSFVNGNLAILNTQRNYGIDDEGFIVANTEGARITLDVAGLDVGDEVTTLNAALSLSRNDIRAGGIL